MSGCGDPGLNLHSAVMLECPWVSHCLSTKDVDEYQQVRTHICGQEQKSAEKIQSIFAHIIVALAFKNLQTIHNHR